MNMKEKKQKSNERVQQYMAMVDLAIAYNTKQNQKH
jgi:hypothetical protein